MVHTLFVLDNRVHGILGWYCFPVVATVGFDSTAYTVLESDGVLRVCATVTIPPVGCPVNTAFTINLRVERGTAGTNTTELVFHTATMYFHAFCAGYPDDYDAPSSVPMEFSACSRQSCANIDIVSSEQVEAVETFSLLLVTSQERLKLHPNYTTVDIIDDRTSMCIYMYIILACPTNACPLSA